MVDIWNFIKHPIRRIRAEIRFRRLMRKLDIHLENVKRFNRGELDALSSGREKDLQ
jgi:hypothetical protein